MCPTSNNNLIESIVDSIRAFGEDVGYFGYNLIVY